MNALRHLRRHGRWWAFVARIRISNLIDVFFNRIATRRGWEWDEDDWLRRPVNAADVARNARCEFAHSCNAFIEDGWLYCRDGRQALALDRGEIV